MIEYYKNVFVYYWSIGLSSVQLITRSHRLNPNQLWFVFVGECLNIENVPNEFRCRCKDNYQGQFCRYGKFCHSSPCKNGGSCIEGPSSFICHCPPGFTGNVQSPAKSSSKLNSSLTFSVFPFIKFILSDITFMCFKQQNLNYFRSWMWEGLVRNSRNQVCRVKHWV